ncbi:MAG: tripartite tricarboxylate transporter substrate binding protein [Rhodospirillum sp.]|nr:tripartite tricarboxylate transporter substrate binding protein [Rhodospirillum sp.]MCF8488405.1 tripartite tricarboxylate transporter substrate binding protein [Rhodospirillum sp.]MCF8502972.1 tripartite tricarboxylate transporter substrate binding protein [Rhodospirillum sp.]
MINRMNAPVARRGGGWTGKVAAIAALTLCVVFGGPAQAEDAKDFPSKPIEFFVQSGPGSASDIFARSLAKAAEPLFGQPVVVIDKSGGSSAVQMAAVKAAKPDGYTIGVNTISHFTKMLTTLKGSFSKDDYSWIALLQMDPHVIMVRESSPYKSIEDLVAAVKMMPDSQVTVGGYGSMGSTASIAMQMFADVAGIKINWVGYKATPEALSSLLGEHVDVAIANPGVVQQFAEAGRVRVLAILGDKEIDSFPGVPTAEGAGYAFDASWQQMRGVYGPAEIPDDIQKKMGDVFIKAVKDPEFQEYMKNSGLIEATKGPEEYKAFVGKIEAIAEKGLAASGVTN